MQLTLGSAHMMRMTLKYIRWKNYSCLIINCFADPNIMKKLQVDRGAIRFVLAGANIMCPGLTSPGGVLDEDVGAECPVVLPLYSVH